MRRSLAILGACAWLFSSAALAGGYVFELTGEVLVASGKDPVRPAVKNQPVTSDTLVTTGEKSHAVLKFEDGQVVAMQAGSALSVGEYRFDANKPKNNRSFFSGIKGGLLFITGLIGQRSKKSFRLTTPNATIGVRGTEFMLVMTEDGALYGKVKSGSIDVANSAGKAIFKAGQSVLVASPGSKPVAIPVEKLPEGIFSQLEALTLPPVSAGVAPDFPAMDAPGVGAMLPGAETAVTESALLAAAATVAASVPDMPATGLLSVGGAALPLAAAVSEEGSGIVEPVPGQAEGEVAAGGQRGGAGNAGANADNAAVGDATMFGRHNLTPARAATAEICVFCHAPQGAETEVAAPLWNRTASAISEYRAYASIGSATAAATGSISMACLSCHDGSQAPNVVINSPQGFISDYPEGAEPAPFNNDTNYLKNHHPVSMLYGGGGVNEEAPDAPVDALAAFNNADYQAIAVRRLTGPVNDARSRSFIARDYGSGIGEAVPGLLARDDFNRPQHSGSGNSTVWWLESKDTGRGRQKSDFYLYTRSDIVDGIMMNRPYVECASCHDPHSTNPTFLRIKNNGSAVCMTCHAK